MIKNNKLVLITNSAKHYNIQSKVNIDNFPDGEINISIKDKIKNKNAVIIGSTQPPAENLLELILLMDAVRQSGAETIEVIIPYFGYARSDKKNKQNNFVSAKTVIKTLETAGGKNCTFTLIDPHNNDVLQSYFERQFNKINANKQMASQFEKIKNLSIITPDHGSIKKALEFSSHLDGTKIVKINKKRITGNQVKILSISGVVTKNALIVDDIIASGNTILQTAKFIKKRGAKNIYVAVTHTVYSAGGWKKLISSKIINKIITTNSITCPKKLSDKFDVVLLDKMLKNYIYKI